MFERRLKIVLFLPILCGLAIIWRLHDLQIVRGKDYVEKLDSALIAPRQFLPPLRGQVRDRFGRTLVSDEPAHDITIHYGALSMNDAYLMRLSDLLRRQDPSIGKLRGDELQREVHRRIAEMWLALEEISGIPLAELRERRDAICNNVEGLRRHIWQRRREQGIDEPFHKVRLREEDEYHPIIYDASPQVRTNIELSIGRLSLVRIEPSVRRTWQPEAGSLCHVLGRLGQVSGSAIENDPKSGDWLASYRPGDLIGASGIERLGEEMLRGKRGYEEKYLDGRRKGGCPPIDGLDVQLTIDLDLQQQIANILADAVTTTPVCTGASCVVLDIETREVLALVSVPTYDSAAFRTDYASLRDDSKFAPLRFRAVYEEYQPGSILKPVAILAGLANDSITHGTRVFCDGSYMPGSKRWHCWTHWRGMAGHGELAAEEALQHSCNIYFYSLGQRLGAGRITEFYRQFLLGPDYLTAPPRGTGLIEERSGIIPDKDWIARRAKREFGPADGRNYAIGQGEVQITPLQAASIFATIAAGQYREPTLIANDHRDRPELCIPHIEPADWSLVRRGLFRCVNEEGGTAYKYVFMPELAICGKTGHAQCVSRVVKRRYKFRSPDGEMLSAVAPTVEAAREDLGLPHKLHPIRKDIVEIWPPKDPEKGEPPTHAWFAGYAPHEKPKIAMAVIIEYGGGGGATAGPAARAIFETLLHSPRGYLAATDAMTMSSNEP